MTLALRDAGIPADSIDGADPFTALAYRERTGRDASGWSFTDLVDGLPERYGTVVCSFALHLCDRSRLPAVVVALALSADALLIVSPHKRPAIERTWGFELVEETYERLERVRARFYRTLLSAAPTA